ncbi:MAG: orotate phosphoribosyltransferase [Bryobacteraceae bacterium]
MNTKETRHEQLKALILKYSLQHGDTDFDLASGLSSKVYIDAKSVTCRAEGTKLVGRVFLDKIAELGWNPVAVGGLSVGADPIVIAIARESTERPFRPVNAFFVRKEAKKHGLHKLVEGIAEPTNGMPVVIVDDVCTTGGSTATAIGHARKEGMKVIGVICMVDRETGAASTMTELDCPFASIFTLSELLAAEDQPDLEPVTASAA